MYTVEENFLTFFPDIVLNSSYEVLEEMAIIEMKDYCPTFPSKEEYDNLEEPTKNYITKAIYYQIILINEHFNYFLNGTVDTVTSYKIGRTATSYDPNLSKPKQKVSLVSEKFLDESGLCSHETCLINKNNFCGGC